MLIVADTDSYAYVTSMTDSVQWRSENKGAIQEFTQEWLDS